MGTNLNIWYSDGTCLVNISLCFLDLQFGRGAQERSAHCSAYCCSKQELLAKDNVDVAVVLDLLVEHST